MSYSTFIFISVCLDYILGDPVSWPHPIIYIGNMISKYESIIRKNKIINLKIGGYVLLIASLLTVWIVSTSMLYIAKSIHPFVEYIFIIYVLYACLAAKCLHIEGKKVYIALKNNDLLKARKYLSYLVGRETSNLSYNEVTRAVVETIAENTIDGVIAPTLYILLGFAFGAPVQFVLLYKTINTLDSMVGYIQEPYKDIGCASAKLDDIVNYIPARIGSIFMLIAGIVLGYDGVNGYKILLRDRKNHKSPNCAYPESVVAGLLRVQLGGTNTYFGEKVFKPTIGDNIDSLKPDSVIDSIKIMYGSQIITVLTYTIIKLKI